MQMGDAAECAHIRDALDTGQEFALGAAVVPCLGVGRRVGARGLTCARRRSQRAPPRRCTRWCRRSWRLWRRCPSPSSRSPFTKNAWTTTRPQRSPVRCGASVPLCVYMSACLCGSVRACVVMRGRREAPWPPERGLPAPGGGPAADGAQARVHVRDGPGARHSPPAAAERPARHLAPGPRCVCVCVCVCMCVCVWRCWYGSNKWRSRGRRGRVWDGWGTSRSVGAGARAGAAQQAGGGQVPKARRHAKSAVCEPFPHHRRRGGRRIGTPRARTQR
jgi:hypothetical protein